MSEVLTVSTASEPEPASDEVLARARALIAGGDHAGAIAYATSENRRRRDPQLEYHLVRWRLLAAAAVSPALGRRDWPPSIADCFAGVTGAPEVAGAALDSSTLAAGILHHGGLVVRNLLSRDEAAQLVQGIDATVAAAKAAGRYAPVSQTLPWYAPVRLSGRNNDVGLARAFAYFGAGVLTADSPRMLFDLLDIFERRRIVDVIGEYLGERPAFSVKKGTLRRVPGTSGTDWHQDGAFLGAETRAVNVWIALTDCGVDAPGLDFVPRRIDHVVDTGTHGSRFDWSVGPGKIEEVAAGTPVVSPVFTPGDAVVFDHLFLHRTGVRPGMSKTRYAIESWFFAPSTQPADQYPLFI